MSQFEDFCNQAKRSIGNSDNKTTRDVAMCQIVIGLVYSLLAIASAIKDRNQGFDTELVEENKKLRKIANKALDDKNRLLDEKIREINKCKIKRTR